jgi:hypothetical protein
MEHSERATNENYDNFRNGYCHRSDAGFCIELTGIRATLVRQWLHTSFSYLWAIRTKFSHDPAGQRRRTSWWRLSRGDRILRRRLWSVSFWVRSLLWRRRLRVLRGREQHVRLERLQLSLLQHIQRRLLSCWARWGSHQDPHPSPCANS